VIEKNKQTKKEIKRLERENKNVRKKKNDKIGRFKLKMLKKKIFFHLMICNNNYLYFEEVQEHFENLLILKGNRNPSRIFVMTTNEHRLVAAMHQGFCGIPIASYSKFNSDDFVLKIVENYLIKLKYYSDSMTKNLDDFGILIQIPEAF